MWLSSEEQSKTRWAGSKTPQGNASGSTCSLAPRASTAKITPQMTNHPLHTRIKEEKHRPCLGRAVELEERLISMETGGSLERQTCGARQTLRARWIRDMEIGVILPGINPLRAPGSPHCPSPELDPRLTLFNGPTHFLGVGGEVEVGVIGLEITDGAVPSRHAEPLDEQIWGQERPWGEPGCPPNPALVLGLILVLLPNSRASTQSPSPPANTQKIQDKYKKWEKTSPFLGAQKCHHPKATKASCVPISP